MMLLKGAFKQSGDSPNHEANKYVFTMFFIIHPVTKLPHKTCDTTTNWEELNQKPLHDLSWQWFLYLFLCICRISITQVTSRLWIHRITSMFIRGLSKEFVPFDLHSRNLQISPVWIGFHNSVGPHIWLILSAKTSGCLF